MAGKRLRTDFSNAQLMPRTSSIWDIAVSHQRRVGPSALNFCWLATLRTTVISVVWLSDRRQRRLRVAANALNHGSETVGPLWRQVLAEPELGEKRRRVARQDLSGSAS
jgi:hypothetical protein